MANRVYWYRLEWLSYKPIYPIQSMTTPPQPSQAPFLQVSHRRLLVLYSALLVCLIVIMLRQWDREHLLLNIVLSVITLFTIRQIVTETGSTHMDDDGIRFISPWTTSYIAWKDVRSIITSSSTLIFEGTTQRLCIPGPLFWTGSDKRWMRAMIQNRIRTGAITSYSNPWASWYRKRPRKS
jgi:hypothetical protein